MSRITVNSKCRLCRAEGQKLYLKGSRCDGAKCPIEKKGAVQPGMHGVKRRSKISAYGLQLRAKQKAKRLYGVAEAQFKNYYLKAKKLKGLVGDNLQILLERRLDNVVYRAGLSSSRSQAKQFISHRHILVNNKKVNINSYQIKPGDIIAVDKLTSDGFGESLPVAAKDFKPLNWLKVDKNKLMVEVTSLPTKEDLPTDIDLNLIIEYYSR
ncbi:MAG TPA: 30S ribosomal protein S4 [Candidatus Woesebacteria bacterium]|nr:30S ribosomal protein S4 [Candidatus Woesebacteria bacterium]HRS23079.1 30S ribosomal protein S4 [Candidatus Woesebacteria bacterium]HRT39782.1 30S ribosomal protein S4 [Candidatus Woesebacteria bacterium]